MLSKQSVNPQNPQGSSCRPAKEEIIALALGCMHEYAETLAAQLQKSRRQPDCFSPRGDCSEKS